MTHSSEAPRAHRVALRLPDVQARTGLSRSSIYRHVGAGTFPKPFKVGDLAVAWDAVEIDDWLADRMAERTAPHSVGRKRGKGGRQ